MFLLEVGGFMLIGLKQMLAGKKWNTWGQVQGTPGGEVKVTPGGEVGIHKGDN